MHLFHAVVSIQYLLVPSPDLQLDFLGQGKDMKFLGRPKKLWSLYVNVDVSYSSYLTCLGNCLVERTDLGTTLGNNVPGNSYAIECSYF